MASWGKNGNLMQFEAKLVKGMLARGYDEDFAKRLFEQIKGFGGHGFPESHSASFALLTYVSSWLKRHHPAAFYCGLLNSQPMGFYSPSQLLQDSDIKDNIAAWLDELSDKQREVVSRRFGLRGYESSTLEEVGREIGLTRERVRQIQVEALRRLRSIMETQGLSGESLFS